MTKQQNRNKRSLGSCFSISILLCLALLFQIVPNAPLPQAYAEEIYSYALSDEDKALLSDLSGTAITLGYPVSICYYIDARGEESGTLMPFISLLRDWGLTVNPKKINEVTDYATWGQSDIDIYSFATLTRALTETYACSDGMISNGVLAITHSDRSLNDLTAISGLKTGILREPGIREAITPYLTSTDEITYFKNPEEAMDALEQGTIEVFCTTLNAESDVAGHPELTYKNLEGCAPFDKGMVCANEELYPLMHLFNRVLQSETGDQIRSDSQKAVRDSIVEQIQMELDDKITLLRENYDEITVIGTENFYPFCFKQDGRFQGVVPESMALFTEITGIPTQVQTRETYGSIEQIIKALHNGDAQIVAGLYDTLTSDNAQSYSKPICEDSIWLYKLAKSDFGDRDVSELRIGMPSDLYPYVEWQTYFGDTPISYPSERAVYNAIKNGDIDLVLVSQMCVNYDSVVSNNYDFTRFDSTEIILDLRLNYSNSNLTELNEIMNEVITLYNALYSSHITAWNNQVLESQKQYINDEAEKQALFTLYGILAILFVAALLIAVFFSYRRYRKYSEHDKEKLKEIADKDHLSQLLRRGAFIENAQFSRNEEFGVFYVSIIDIDFFKKVNDTYGHEAGDKVIRLVADHMARLFGKIKNSFIGRWGGEEFVVSFPAINKDEAISLIQDLLDSVENDSVLLDMASGKSIQVTLSAGLTEWTKGDSLDFAIQQADTALYTSKENGRNQVTFKQ